MTEFFNSSSQSDLPLLKSDHYNFGIYLLLHKVSSFLSTQSFFFCTYVESLAKEHKQAFCFVLQ